MSVLLPFERTEIESGGLSRQILAGRFKGLTEAQKNSEGLKDSERRKEKEKEQIHIGQPDSSISVWQEGTQRHSE